MTQEPGIPIKLFAKLRKFHIKYNYIIQTITFWACRRSTYIKNEYLSFFPRYPHWCTPHISRSYRNGHINPIGKTVGISSSANRIEHYNLLAHTISMYKRRNKNTEEKLEKNNYNWIKVCIRKREKSVWCSLFSLAIKLLKPDFDCIIRSMPLLYIYIISL